MAISSNSEIQVRVARPEDAEHIVRIGTEAFSSTFGHSVTPDQLQTYLDEAYTFQAISNDIHDPIKRTFVAINSNDQVLGFALLTQETTEPCLVGYENMIELQRIYVDLTHHGKGIARLMSNRVEKEARHMGFRYIWLGVWEENFKAQKVYERLGYQLVGEHAFDVGGDIQNDLIMVKAL